MHYLKGVREPTRSLDNLTVKRADTEQTVASGITIEEARDHIVRLRNAGVPAEDITVSPASSSSSNNQQPNS